MKTITTLFILLCGITFSNAQVKKQAVKKPASQTTTTKSSISKFGALAIDRSNGFYYGFSYDYATLAEAEQKAIEECSKKGGNCSVVLSFSGTGCAAYRTIDGKAGTAYGWGFAKTKEEADAIAMKEALKRSNGVNPSNFVWSCNSANTGTLKEIYNATDEIINSVTIGNQIWSNENLKILKFRNGDPIPQAKTTEEWLKFRKNKKAAYMNLCHLPGQKDCGIMYNIYAVLDERGLAPKGWKVPSKQDWEKLSNYLGGLSSSGTKLSSKEDWMFTKGNNSSGFNAKPCDVWRGGDKMEPQFEYGRRTLYWTNSMDREYNLLFSISSYDSYMGNELWTGADYYGAYVRLIKE